MRTLGGDDGSVTILGAVSPPGNDLTEPVTAHTRRAVRCVWTLDRDLAYARHYPAVTWRDSSSRDAEALAGWHEQQGDPAWSERRRSALSLLDEADRRQVVADLVGVASLPAGERLTLWAARMLRELVLRQSALNPNEVFCAPAKQAALLRLALDVHAACRGLADRGVEPAAIEALGFGDAIRARDESAPGDAAAVDAARVRAARTPGGPAVSLVPRVEYESLAEIRGPLLVVEGVEGVGWDEVAEIRLGSGERRNGVVLDVASRRRGRARCSRARRACASTTLACRSRAHR